MRRKYFKGRCQDCAHWRNVTRIIFWVNGMPYLVCADCIKPYRDRIMQDEPVQEEIGGKHA